MKYVSENTRQWIKAFLLSVMLGGAQAALAAGGLSSAESSLKDVILSFYGIVAILAGLAMLVTAVWGYLGHKTLKDVVEVCAWIFFAGASLAIAKAIFDWGKQAYFS
ncbi:Uncharacterised protein [Neisseria animaloris]|uniref:hypothetical protein n=1 Tax=Neisseria animaloris TaxID=326522 RepID=UPI000A19903D|nr:hypothetical protein [Neisseria animaloris]OSI07401.1 hypothetical protein BWD08_07585 [Neisseria animaloris]VEH87787.1 Uncharacterised protein [Neisseria animaloris]